MGLLHTRESRADVVPSLAELHQLAAQGNLVPVYRELPADLDTPVSVYLKLVAHGAAFLLESVEGGEQVGRYSFIGVAPRARLAFTGRQVMRQVNGERTDAVLPEGRDPLHVLQDELARFRPVVLPDLPRFVGGLVGYLGYDTVRFFEPRLAAHLALPGERDLPDALFLLADTLVAFDHARGRLLIIANAHLDGDLHAAYAEALARIEAIATALAQPLARGVHAPAGALSPLRSNFSRVEFEALVRRAQASIAAGDVFQVVLSQRLARTTAAAPFDIYRALRRLNPSPYMFYFDFGTVQGAPYHVVGASPEMLVRLEGCRASLRPIAGTRPRGRQPAEDLELERALTADPKERAEHVMLVDLGRNDLGRVCRYGSIGVPAMLAVERYSHVMHLVSQVEGILKDGLNCFDLLRATFPAGTVSGAPKVRAMELIAELEGAPRGLYAGAAGYFSYDGAMDTCIAIRTLQLHGDQLSVQAGAGIVADSDPGREYEETLSKARALALAVEMAEAQGGHLV
jgi:anthranilate synthase component 1